MRHLDLGVSRRRGLERDSIAQTDQDPIHHGIVKSSGESLFALRDDFAHHMSGHLAHTGIRYLGIDER
jgi:hypothetical protein